MPQKSPNTSKAVKKSKLRRMNWSVPFGSVIKRKKSHLFEWLAEIICHLEDSGRIGGHWETFQLESRTDTAFPRTLWHAFAFGGWKAPKHTVFFFSIFFTSKKEERERATIGKRIKKAKHKKSQLSRNKWYVLLNLEVKRFHRFLGCPMQEAYQRYEVMYATTALP